MSPYSRRPPSGSGDYSKGAGSAKDRSVSAERFEVVADVNGRRLPLTYEITEYDRPRRVVLAGEGSTFRGLDE